MSIANGYQKSRHLYRANNRVKTVQLALFVGINREGEASELFTVYHAKRFPAEKTVPLQDTFGFQKIPLPFDWPRVLAFRKKVLAEFKSGQSLADGFLKLDWQYILQIKLVAVFKGSKYDDTCFSEIKFGHPSRQHPAIAKVYLNAAENTIYMDTPTADRIVLDRDPTAVFQIIDTSPDRQWVIVIRMSVEAGDSRIETTYALYNTQLKHRVPAETLGSDVGEMYDFERVGKTIYLNYLNNKTGEIERFDLNAVYRRLTVSN